MTETLFSYTQTPGPKGLRLTFFSPFLPFPLPTPDLMNAHRKSRVPNWHLVSAIAHYVDPCSYPLAPSMACAGVATSLRGHALKLGDKMDSPSASRIRNRQLIGFTASVATKNKLSYIGPCQRLLITFLICAGTRVVDARALHSVPFCE